MRKKENIFGFVKTNKPNKMYTEEQFYQDVLTEATALRDLSTPTEKDNLVFEHLKPQSRSNCVYGLMTGDCNSRRAVELIKKCCTQYFHAPSLFLGGTLPNVLSHVDGTNPEVMDKRITFLNINYISSIEMYITSIGAKNRGLIAYIKGETNELNLKIE